jgi:phosphate transport system protein
MRTQAGAVERAIQFGIDALRDPGGHLAEEVIAGDTLIDREEIRVEEECLKVLALHQPVAGDLRRIITVLRINTDLERMADLAVHIAERADALAKLPPIAVPAKLEAMAERTLQLVRQGLAAYFRLDADLARQVIACDDEVDGLNREIIEELLEVMQHESDNVRPCVSLFSVVRHLERIADHATNIAEEVVYLVEGTIIRHAASGS